MEVTAPPGGRGAWKKVCSQVTQKEHAHVCVGVSSGHPPSATVNVTTPVVCSFSAPSPDGCAVLGTLSYFRPHLSLHHPLLTEQCLVLFPLEPSTALRANKYMKISPGTYEIKRRVYLHIHEPSDVRQAP